MALTVWPFNLIRRGGVIKLFIDILNIESTFEHRRCFRFPVPAYANSVIIPKDLEYHSL